MPESIENIIKENLNLKGEIVLIVEGNNENINYDYLPIIDHINLYIEEGLIPKEAIKKVAKERNLPKSEVYNEYLKQK